MCLEHFFLRSICLENKIHTHFLFIQNQIIFSLCDKITILKNLQILLENILPAHVAEHFLSTRNTQDLYHERYSCVAVMFASIPNYKEFYDESDVNKQGLECLRLLNEIICEFDKVCIASSVKSHFIRFLNITIDCSSLMLRRLTSEI